MLRINYLKQYLMMFICLITNTNTNYCDGTITNKTNYTPPITPTTTPTTHTTTHSTIMYTTNPPYKHIDNKCIGNSYCFPFLMLIGSVSFIIIMIYLCLWCITKINRMDKREKRLANAPIRYVINDIYEYNTEYDNKNNNQYSEI